MWWKRFGLLSVNFFLSLSFFSLWMCVCVCVFNSLSLFLDCSGEILTMKVKTSPCIRTTKESDMLCNSSFLFLSYISPDTISSYFCWAFCTDSLPIFKPGVACLLHLTNHYMPCDTRNIKRKQQQIFSLTHIQTTTKHHTHTHTYTRSRSWRHTQDDFEDAFCLNEKAVISRFLLFLFVNQEAPIYF